MLRTALVLAALLFPSASSAAPTEVVPDLWADAMPEIPKKVKDRMRQYRNTRSASFQDWTGEGMLISTRFGETSQIHRVERPNGARRQLTFDEEPVRGAEAGSWLGEPGFFYSKDVGGAEAYQVFHFAEETGKHVLISDGKSRNLGHRLSRDKTRLAYASTRRNDKDYDIYVQDVVKGGAPRRVFTGTGYWAVRDWSPAGKELLISRYVSINESYVHRLDIASGGTSPLLPKTSHKSAYGAVSYSVDGKGVFFVSDRWGEFKELGYLELSSGRVERLTREIPWDVAGLEVGPRGRHLAFTTNEGGLGKLHVWRLPKRRPLKLPALPAGQVYGLEFDDKGRRLALTMNTPTTPGDVYTLNLRKRALSRWTRSEVGGLDTSRFVSPDLIEFPTFDKAGAKKRMTPAFYFKPRGKGPFPVVVAIHGGPESQWRPWFRASQQYWLNELGIAVLAPNVRGSAGYGKSYLLLDNGFKREDSVKDIGALLDWIAERPELDSSRVAVYGGSYGGYMVLASMARFADRIKAGVDIVGISNFVTFLKNTKDYRRDLRRAEYGDERDPKMRAFLESISPTNLAGDIRSPLFVAQGANDPRVPESEAAQMVEKVRESGTPVWYLLAKDEGHGFRKKKNRDYYANAVSLFWETHLLK